MRSLSLSLSIIAFSFVVLGCGVSPTEQKTDTDTATTASSSTSTTTQPDGGATVAADAMTVSDTLAVSIDSELAVKADSGVVVEPPCSFDGQFAKYVPSTCSPKEGVNGGKYVCRVIANILQPNCELVNGVTSTPDAGSAVAPDAKPADTIDAPILTDTAPAVTTSPFCKYAGEYPAALAGACSPAPGQKNGSFVCRVMNGVLQPNCESTPAPVTPAPDAGTQADTTPAATPDTQVLVDTTPVVKTDASATDTTPVVLADSGTTTPDVQPLIDTQVTDTTPVSTDTVPDTLGATDVLVTTDSVPNSCNALVGTQLTSVGNGQTVSCSDNGFDGQSTCNSGVMSQCVATSATTSGLRAVLDCQLTGTLVGKITLTGNATSNLTLSSTNPGDVGNLARICLVGDGGIGGMIATNRDWCLDYHADSNFSYIFKDVPLVAGDQRITRITFIGVTASGTVRWSNNMTIVYANTVGNRCSYSETVIDDGPARTSFIRPLP